MPKPSDATRGIRRRLQKEREQAVVDEKIRLLMAEINGLKKKVVSHDMVRQEILKLSKATIPQPTWTLQHPSLHPGSSPGVPSLFLSDWHWGEVVDKKQVNGVNEYNLEIAHRRAFNVINNATKILRGELSRKEIPGLVLILGGDMFSGDIHDELSRTNEQPIMPMVLDLYGVLIEVINVLADEYGQIFIPCVSGNHSRITHKPFSKERSHLSFDWLLYSFLAKQFAKDSRVRFLIPEGPNALFRIYGQTYLLNHGDEFRGGDGQVGPLGPIIRGDHKKRSKASMTGQEYDTMLIGHFHKYMPLGSQLIVNGSLVGYNEYANAGNFGFDVPQQALWMTHPTRGITSHWPVFAEDANMAYNKSWISIMEE